jgi:hypothetical protein
MIFNQLLYQLSYGCKKDAVFMADRKPLIYLLDGAFERPPPDGFPVVEGHPPPLPCPRPELLLIKNSIYFILNFALCFLWRYSQKSSLLPLNEPVFLQVSRKIRI